MKEIAMTGREVALKMVDEKLNVLNAINKEEKQDPIKLVVAQADVTTALVELNIAEKVEDFSKILATDNPAMSAIKHGAITFTTLKNPTEKTPEYTLATKIEVIDLAELKAFADDNSEKPIIIFVDQRALTFVEGLNHLVFNYAANGMNIKRFGKRLDTFRLKNTANLLKVEPTQENSIKGIKQAMQTAVDKIVEGLTVSDDDVVSLLMNYSKWGKEINSVSMPVEASFRRMITRVLYKVSNGVEFIGE